MKKNFLLLIVWALASAFTFATGTSAGDNLAVRVEPGDDARSVIVRLANLDMLTTQIGIHDADGHFWLSKFITDEFGYAGRIVLDGLPDGDYILFVRNRNVTRMEVFTMYPDEIVFFDDPAGHPADYAVAANEVFMAPGKGALIARFDAAEASLEVRLANLQQRKTQVTLISLGGDGHVNETIRGRYGYACALNMEGMREGTYFVYVDAYDATVVQMFSFEDENIKLEAVRRMEQPAYTPMPEEEFDEITVMN